MPALQVKGSSKPASTPASNMYVSCTLKYVWVLPNLTEHRRIRDVIRGLPSDKLR